MKNILILGSSGLIGTHLVECALKNNYSVTAASRNKCEYEGAETAFFDIYSHDIDKTIINHKVYDSVVVTAWNGHQRDKRNDYSVNKKCADSLKIYLEKLCNHCEIGQIILCGSMKEYGELAGRITEEVKPNTNSISAYGLAKLNLYSNLIHSTICKSIAELRFHSVYGYINRCDQMIGNVLKTIAQGNNYNFNSNCNQKYDFTHVNDTAEAILLASDRQLSGIYNVSSNSTFTLKDYILSAVEVCNLDFELISFGKLSEKSSELISDKFRNVTGWFDKVNFRSGVKDMYCHICEEMENDSY